MKKKTALTKTESKKLAIFDIDGTVFRSAVMMEVVDRMIQEGMLPKSTYATVVEARDAWKNRQGKFETYNERFIHLMEHDFKGVEVEPFETLAAEVIGEIKDHQYRYTHELMQQFRERGYALVAISGTQKIALDIYNRYLGFDYVYASEVVIENGRFTDRLVTESPYYDKSATVSQLLKEHPELTLDDSYGVGDTESDVGFLEMVSHPIAFNPNKSLYEVAQQKDWEIVVERKDVIYHINPPGGGEDVRVE